MSRHGDILEGLRVAHISEGKRNEFEEEAHNLTKDWLDELDKFLKSNGYTVKNETRRAMFEISCWKDKKNRMTIIGLIGNGNYTDTAIIYRIYFDENHSKPAFVIYDEVIPSPKEDFSSEAQVKDYKNNLEKAMGIIKDKLSLEDLWRYQL